VLVEDEPWRGLGPALAWAWRQGASSLQLVAERDTGLLARRAHAFSLPITVWRAEQRDLIPAVVEPLGPPPRAAEAHLALVPTIEAGGAVPVVEHGVVTGEVRGLEVCRVVDDPATGHVRLEVGVGAHDREAFALIHGDVPTVDALAEVVRAVTRYRGAESDHPLNRIAPERLLRWRLEQTPESIGLASLVASEPPVPRPGVTERTPCTASGRRSDGSTVLAVCSVGVDLDVIPYATDARRSVEDRPGVDGGREATETLVVVPPRDLVPVTAELAELLVQAVAVVSASPPST
jgi:hypothetical protein